MTAPPLVAATDLLLQVNVDIDLNPALGLVGGGAGAFLTTLIVGATLLALAPDYTTDRIAAVLDNPLGAFVYGIVVFVFLAIVTFVLAVTIIGLLVALPLALLLYVLWAVGSTIAFLAVADRLVGHGDGWTRPLVVAAAINGGLAFTGIGGIVAFVVGAVGFGVVLEGVF
jgi:hypothetical protein